MQIGKPSRISRDPTRLSLDHTGAKLGDSLGSVGREPRLFWQGKS